MAVPALDKGSVETMFLHGDAEASSSPVLQILSVKKVSPAPMPNGQTGADRYRLILSDSAHFIQAMLATQLNHLIGDGQIEKHAVVRLDQYAINKVQNRSIVICLGIEVLGKETDKIGDPSSVEKLEKIESQAPKGVNPFNEISNVSRASAPAKSAIASKNARATNGPNTPIYPIEGLSPYQNKWTIKARVTLKSDIRHYTNAKGDGKVFSVNLLDESGEIRATGFNDAVDNLFNVFEEGKVYYVSKARVNISKNKQYNPTNNEYEIMFERDTQVELCTDTTDLPQVKYNFVNLSDLTTQEANAMIDVLGVVKEVGELSSIVSKATSKQIPKREIVLIDQSEFSVRMTLWGRQAEQFSAPDQPIIAFKGVKVGDFGGRSLSMVSSSTMAVDPDIQPAHSLSGWMKAVGETKTFQTFKSTGGGAGGFKEEEAKTIAQIKEEGLGMQDTPDNFFLRATIVYVKKDSLSYPACPKEGCNKKVTPTSEGSFRCEKCSEDFPAPQHRYVMSLSVLDHTGQLWLSAFDDAGRLILDHSADDIERLRDEDEQAFVGAIWRGSGKAYNFACRARTETFQDTSRVRYQINRATPVDYVAASAWLVKQIEGLGFTV
ncbi:uncharacterized protein L969DRAFT_86148 [Mixia osmundae IAM 14324]|uniref:Replication protein A subunit n=1 Tax=Mixia osmundae (strain CBS 9802 / IAM 14324 / JCM 22182 / KY 12970) TaxID=764103 RepID=G7EAS7_MIXOS|nr:uncharacterized protein L969DRAFT_86148 [Mixia osmundae IAM 14324]KEI40906.1 hypothetical protein L969DRAFT_86148 [Mixia osmundae IAM 14324]GAA99937.1 hypothetical protein E5Q_06640 [Mixia osmundae IAM 14324]